MPTEPPHDATGRYVCPVCGSSDTQPASAVVEDRIRNAIAAHWAKGPGPEGPDGRWLRSSVIAWVGMLAFALVTSSQHFIARWEWGALLLAALALGVWADRRAARRRGWIDPMQRAAAVVQRARTRDAMLDEAARGAGVLADTSAHSEHELICLQCGHRFEPAPTAVSAA
ncbi:MAG TPA: hypothetical protein VFI92_02625 [Steroidobacteraceae bacterium]|nr:hypothetical protein [Steroidobacteraceae bacterium]